MSIATFYFQDPRAPEPNRPAHLGVNVLLQWQDKLLLGSGGTATCGGCPAAVSGPGAGAAGHCQGGLGGDRATLAGSGLSKRWRFSMSPGNCQLSGRQRLAHGGRFIPGLSGAGAQAAP